MLMLGPIVKLSEWNEPVHKANASLQQVSLACNAYIVAPAL